MSRKGEAEPHDRQQGVEISKAVLHRDARGCGEAHLELPPCIPLPPASTTWKPSVLSHPPWGGSLRNHPYCHIHPWGGHLKTIRNVTRGLPRAAHRQQLPPPSGGGAGVIFLSSPEGGPLFRSMQYAVGMWERRPNKPRAPITSNVGWFLFQRLVHVWEQSRCNTLLLLQPYREPD